MDTEHFDNRPIGVFDSGYGGLTVARALQKRLPEESILYFGDSARCPYGPRDQAEVDGFVQQICTWLVGRDVKMIVIACNTATAAGLAHAQENFSVPVVGVVEPGARAAAHTTLNRRVGVIATKGTVDSNAYSDAIRHIDAGITVFSTATPRFVEIAEMGLKLSDGPIEDYMADTTKVYIRPEFEDIARQYLEPLRRCDIDTLVLGCTHYPLLTGIFSKLCGPNVTLINPGHEAIASLKTLLEKGDALLLVNKSAAAGKIIAALPYIDQVRIGVAFPNVVRIEVKELDTAYAVTASDGTYWLINSSGRVVEETTGKAAAGYLQLTGFQVDPPKAGATISASSAAAKTDQQTGDTASGSENGDATSDDQTGDTTSGGEATAANTEETDDATPEERLQTALEILQALESSGAAGVTQINVASLHDIKVFYGTQYEVDFGAAVDLSYKVEYMLAAVAQLDDYESGVLDLTFQEEKTARFIPFES